MVKIHVKFWGDGEPREKWKMKGRTKWVGDDVLGEGRKSGVNQQIRLLNGCVWRSSRLEVIEKRKKNGAKQIVVKIKLPTVLS